MSTSNEFLMNKGLSYKVTAKARGYYDFSTILNPDGTAITYEMLPYDGLKYNVNLTYNDYEKATINLSETKLPYLGLANQSLITSEYCLGKTGVNYTLDEYQTVNYINKTGDVTIEDGIAGNFSTSNYLTTDKKNADMTIICKFSTGSSVNTNQNVINLPNWFVIELRSDGICKCYNFNTGGYLGLFSIKANTTYYVKIVTSSDGTRIYSYSTDGATYNQVQTYTDSTDWSTVGDSNIYLGIYGANLANPMLGTIDLNNSSITIEDKTYILSASEIQPSGKTKTYPGIFDADYTDTSSEKTLNCFADSNKYIVLSEKENYKDLTWLGTVNIPEHKLYED